MESHSFDCSFESHSLENIIKAIKAISLKMTKRSQGAVKLVLQFQSFQNL